MAVNIGMWLERFMIIVISLHRDFMPSAWGMYYPTRWDLFHVLRHDRTVPVAAVSVHPLPSADLHLRNAGTGQRASGGAARRGEGVERKWPKQEPHLRIDGGVREPEQLLEAARRTHEAGYARIDAFSPFPDRRSCGSHRLSPHAIAAGRSDRRDHAAAPRDIFCSITPRWSAIPSMSAAGRSIAGRRSFPSRLN